MGSSVELDTGDDGLGAYRNLFYCGACSLKPRVYLRPLFNKNYRLT